MPDESPFDKQRVVAVYTKSNYRVIGRQKHSAVKPCHWLEQKLLTGRDNRNCYKGYFGIESHLCIQNTPALPFCTHQCVFCWRDIENGSFGSEWKGEVEDPKHLAKEMIRHSLNIIFEHISKARSLENLVIMRQIMALIAADATSSGKWDVDYTETGLAQRMGSTHNKIERAMLVLKAMDILLNPGEEDYRLHPRLHGKLLTEVDALKLIADEVTTEADIERVFEEARHPRHAAISLAGEPTLYPRLGELVAEFRQRKICTFIVSNGTHPEAIRHLQEAKQLPTQLYITLAAPTKETYLRICRPLISDGWDRLMETLRMFPKLDCRTVVRITAVKHVNIDLGMVPAYAAILREARPNFIDIKGLTVEGNALELQKRLHGDHELREYGPSYTDLLTFATALAHETGFEIVATSEVSRDILLRGSWPAGKSIKIDFDQV